MLSLPQHAPFPYPFDGIVYRCCRSAEQRGDFARTHPYLVTGYDDPSAFDDDFVLFHIPFLLSQIASETLEFRLFAVGRVENLRFSPFCRSRRPVTAWLRSDGFSWHSGGFTWHRTLTTSVCKSPVS